MPTTRRKKSKGKEPITIDTDLPITESASASAASSTPSTAETPPEPVEPAAPAPALTPPALQTQGQQTRRIRKRAYRARNALAAPSSMGDEKPSNKHLFRVQHAEAFTQFDRTKGFEIQANYSLVEYHNWVNEEAFRNHLNGFHMQGASTPFISLFTNHRDANALAIRLQDFGCKQVLIARIPTSTLERACIEISPPGHITIMLPAWQDIDTAVLFVTAADVSRYLGVQLSDGHLSEWFAMARIPSSMIQSLERFN